MSRFAIILILSFSALMDLHAAGQVADSLKTDNVVFTTDTTAHLAIDSGKADSVIQFARKFIGHPYAYGSTSGKSFDCSGYTQHVLAGFDVKLPHSSSGQFTECYSIMVNEVQKGDLLFFTGRNSGSKTIGHVSIVTEVHGDRIKMIHATTHGGVIEEWMNDSKYFKPRLLHAGRLKQMPQVAVESKKAEEPVKQKKKSKKKRKRK